MEPGRGPFAPSSLLEALDSLKEGLQVISPDLRYLYVNETVARQGRKTAAELLGRTMMECYPGIDQAPFFGHLRSCLTNRESKDLENEFRHENGDVEWFELRIRPCAEGAVILSVDITARKRLEATLRQVQKLDAVGKLAGGVAHDFNNILTVISSCAAFLRDELPADGPHRPDALEILQAADRGAKLTRQLLAFSRNQTGMVEVVAMNALVTNLGPMLARLLGEGIRVRTALAAAGEVKVDVNAMEQVLVNLAVNARDAMPDGGELLIETRDLELTDAYSESRGGVLAPGSYVVTSVTDHGAGMPREVQDRLFEPFFTTKTGRGTGLGLATSYGAVRQAGGFIWVYSEVGRGSTFKIYLPRAGGGAEAQAAAPAEPVRPGSGTILVVEDDVQILQVLSRTLEGAGYQVLSASSVAEAEARAAAFDGTIDLLVSDVVLPGESGLVLPGRLAPARPGLRVLFITGYTENAVPAASAGGERRLLEKPFTPQELLAAVAAALVRE